LYRGLSRAALQQGDEEMKRFIFLTSLSVCWFFLLGCDNFGPNRYEIITNNKGEIIRIDKKTGAIHIVEDGELVQIEASESQTLTDSLLKKSGIREKRQLDTSWHWAYSGIDSDEKNYPMVVLRYGHKAIKRVGDKILVGWNYIILNTSPYTPYMVTIDYKFSDEDDFDVATDTAKEWVRAKDYVNVKNTLLISADDYERISRDHWIVSLSPNWQDKELKGDRFERAAKILKDNCPYWYKDRLKHLFMDAFDKDGEINFTETFYPQEWVIAQKLRITPEKRLLAIGEIVEVDFTEYELPPWKEISGHPRYSELSKDDKAILKDYLRLKKGYGKYSPTKGRKSVSWLSLPSDFPEPVTQTKADEQNQKPPSE